VTEAKVTINGMAQNCLIVDIKDCETSLIVKAWKNSMKSYEARVTSKKNTVKAENALIQVIDLNKMDVHAIVEAITNGARLSVSFETGKNAFLSSENNLENTNTAKQFLYDFAIQMRKGKVMADLADSKSKLTKYEQRKDQLIKQKNNLEINIEKHKESIVDDENEIELNQLEQEKNLKKIENQKIVVKKIQEKFDAIE